MVYIRICFASQVLLDSLKETMPGITSVGWKGGGGREKWSILDKLYI